MLALKIWHQVLSEGVDPERIRELVASEAMLYYLDVDVTGFCPLKCSHCIFHPENFKDAELLEWDILQARLREAISLGVAKFTITGKEPLSSSRTFDVLSLLRAQRDCGSFQYGLVTNGLYVSKHLPALASSDLDFLDLSIDGPENVHDRMRGHGTHRLALAALEQLRPLLGRRISISTVVHADSADRLPDWVCEFGGAERFYLSPVIPTSYHPYPVPPDTTTRLLAQLRAGLAKASARQVFLQLFPRQIADAVRHGQLSFDQMNIQGIDLVISEQIGNSLLTVGLQIFPYDFWGGARITSDGYYLPSCIFLSSKEYRQWATGHVGRDTLGHLHAQTLATDGLFHRMLQQWADGFRPETLEGAFCPGLNMSAEQCFQLIT